MKALKYDGVSAPKSEGLARVQQYHSRSIDIKYRALQSY